MSIPSPGKLAGTLTATVSVTVNTTNHMTTEQFNTLRARINQAHRAIAQGQSLVSFVLHAHLNNRAIAKRGYRIALRELAMTPSYH